MKSKITNSVAMILGLLLLVTGLFLPKIGAVLQDVRLTLPYICMGVGCGLFSHGIGNLISQRALRNDPELKKKLDIEKKDERNIAIMNQAKSKAFDAMTFVFSALMLCFALMGVDVIPLLLLVFAYLLVHGLVLYYRFQLEKEM